LLIDDCRLLIGAAALLAALSTAVLAQPQTSQDEYTVYGRLKGKRLTTAR